MARERPFELDGLGEHARRDGETETSKGGRGFGFSPLSPALVSLLPRLPLLSLLRSLAGQSSLGGVRPCGVMFPLARSSTACIHPRCGSTLLAFASPLACT